VVLHSCTRARNNTQNPEGVEKDTYKGGVDSSRVERILESNVHFMHGHGA